MGLELDLDTSDYSFDGLRLPKDFKNQIILQWYFKFNTFLSLEEEKIIEPNAHGEINLGLKHPSDRFFMTSTKICDRERSPKLLKDALLKTEQYLLQNSEQLPLVHKVYSSPILRVENELEVIVLDGIETHLGGDLYYYDDYNGVRNKIHARSYDDNRTHDFMINVTPIVTIGDQEYWTKTVTKADQFKAEFEKCYHFLDLAIKENKMVLWEMQ